MQVVTEVCLWLLAGWCFVEAGISVWIIKSWDRPYHSEDLNRLHQAMTPRDHRSLKFMHARHAVGWLLGGCLAVWSVTGGTPI
jgi:hypothetical protein